MSRLAVLGLALVVVACAENLPDQDLRITSVTVPAFKLSAPDLWMDFQRDPVGARKKYFGQSIDISAVATAIEPDPKKTPHIYFAQNSEHGVRARLLDDRVPDTVKDIKVGDRIRLRCYVEGIDDKQDVLLKSCIRPQ